MNIGALYTEGLRSAVKRYAENPTDLGAWNELIGAALAYTRMVTRPKASPITEADAALLLDVLGLDRSKGHKAIIDWFNERVEY